MKQTNAQHVAGLSEEVNRMLESFVSTCKEGLGDTLHSLVLFGSAAEGKLRPTSDVNLLVLLNRFEETRIDNIRESLQFAQVAIRLAPMFLLNAELPQAATLFAQKFFDLRRRYRVLYGPDAISGLHIPRGAVLDRVQQVLLTVTLRLRHTYVAKSLQEEQLPAVIANVAGPLRSCAAIILELQEQVVVPPKEAFSRLVLSLSNQFDGLPQWISQAREKKALPPGVAGPTVLKLIEVADAFSAKVRALT